MNWSERAFNLAVGLSALSWAVLGLALHPLSAPRIVIAALNLTVGTLLILRSPVAKIGSARAIIASLPGVIVAGFAIKLAPPLESWSPLAAALFAGGGAIAILSFLCLGKSFAILPARREIAIRGTYRIIRHPAYAGELLMVGACLAAGPTIATGALLACTIPLVVLRIIVEERVLREDEAYGIYADRVRSRLVPGVW